MEENQSSTEVRSENTTESTSEDVGGPCMNELKQLISVTLESSPLDIRKLQQAANDLRLCAKIFKICGVKLEQSFLVESNNQSNS